MLNGGIHNSTAGTEARGLKPRKFKVWKLSSGLSRNSFDAHHRLWGFIHIPLVLGVKIQAHVLLDKGSVVFLNFQAGRAEAMSHPSPPWAWLVILIAEQGKTTII